MPLIGTAAYAVMMAIIIIDARKQTARFDLELKD